jgi:hypothetical protein
MQSSRPGMCQGQPVLSVLAANLLISAEAMEHRVDRTCRSTET